MIVNPVFIRGLIILLIRTESTCYKVSNTEKSVMPRPVDGTAKRGVAMDEKVNIAGISVITSAALALGKIVAGTAMGSASVFASGIHSGLDLLASVLAYSSVSQSSKPADEDHRYGHGKYENLAALIEAALILIAAGVIINSAVRGILSPVLAVQRTDLGIAVMGVSALVSFPVSAMLAGAYRRSASPALREDCRHLLANACASLAICLGLAAMRLTGPAVIDSALALLVAAVLLFEGCGHLKKSAGGIVDVKLSGAEEEVIKEVLARHGEEYVQYHALRTRRSGPDCHVDLHLVVPRDQVIARTHQLCDAIEKDITNRLPGVSVLIHAEPCRPVSGECGNCGIEKSLPGEEAGECSAKPPSDKQ